MKHSTGRSDISVAESRLAQAKCASRESFAQVRSAIRSRLAQPSSLLIATGVGALLGVWFARPGNSQLKQDADSVPAPIVGLVSTLLVRFGIQRLADTWTRLRDSGTR
jgi:hypothetical protein